MSEMTFRLSLFSTYKESEKIPDFVSDIQKKSNLTEETTGTLMLLLSEAVTNAIVHGNKLDASKKVDVKIIIDADQVISVVEDQGEGFDPDQSRNPVTEENLLNESGRGIFLINELSDAVEYLNEGSKLRFVINR